MVQDIHTHYSLNEFHKFNEIGQDPSLLFNDDIIEDYYQNPSSSSFVTLRNGIQMPLLGLGTTHSGGYKHESVIFALRKCGYRMIDTARRYGVETQLGYAIRESGIPREDFFINTKLWSTDFGYGVKDACNLACKKLGIDYLDSYLLHLPIVPDDMGDRKTILQQTWREMEKLYDSEKIKTIGVSNFNISDLEIILEDCSIIPHINQCEFHPCENPIDVRDYCKEEDIYFAGYCPLAKGKILDLDLIQNIAKKHNRTPAQICIRWSIQNNVCAIPKSRKFSRLFENSLIYDFELTEDEMSKLDNLHKTKSIKIINLENVKKTMHLPDGYKLH